VTSIAASSDAAAEYVVYIWMLVIGAGIITWLKAHRIAFVLGLFTIGLTWVVAACRLAKPDSFWARHAYGDKQRARARARYA